MNASPHRTTRRAALGVALAALASASAPANGPAARYSVSAIDLPAGYTWLSAHGLNNKGDVTGTVGAWGSAEHRAFVRAADGQFTLLGTLGGYASHGSSINDAGQVAGWSNSSSEIPWGEVSAFVCAPPDALTNLGSVTGDPEASEYAWGYGINSSGHVAVHGEAFALHRAFLWRPKEGLINLGALGFSGASARDVNDLDHVVGATAHPQTNMEIGFVWKNGEMTPLPTPSQDVGARALAISNSGLIVGVTSNSYLGGPALMWPNAHSVVVLPSFAPNAQGVANDVNDAGLIVGSSRLADNEERAAVWFNGEIHDLTARLPTGSGWILESATAVNNGGQILASGQRDGAPGSVLLTPLPAKPAPGDITADGAVNVSDLLAVIASWGPCAAQPCPADLNADSTVNVTDLLIVVANWTG